MTVSYLSFVLAVLFTSGLYVLKARSKRNTLPPGPPAIPFMGHAHLIPSVGQDIYFYNLGKVYGDVVHLKVLNKCFIILNSAQAAFDIVDKGGGNYRNRPKLPIFEILGIGETMAFLDDSEEYRSQRKMLQQYLGKEKVKEYHWVQAREARILAQNLLSKPENFLKSCLRFSTGVIMELIFGHRVETDYDPYVEIAEDCSHLLQEVGPPGGTPVDFLPFLQRFPSWFPGAYYAGLARRSSWRFKRLLEYPFEQAKEQMAKGTARPSFITTQLEQCQEELEGHHKIIQNAAAIAYLGGAETSSSTLAYFLLAMVLYPECQSQAQEEIDSVIGRDRLPEFTDRQMLPYLECILQETLRWNHAVPAGVPHTALEDDIYNGMTIPKGATVVTNTRGMTYDSSIYKDATVFDPTRFLAAPAGRGEPYATAVFGFGRRKCPGRYLGEDNVWIGIATILATLTIQRAKDHDGKEIIPDVVLVAEGITSHPKEFPFVLEPRTDKAVELLSQSLESG